MGMSSVLSVSLTSLSAALVTPVRQIITWLLDIKGADHECGCSCCFFALAWCRFNGKGRCWRGVLVFGACPWYWAVGPLLDLCRARTSRMTARLVVCLKRYRQQAGLTQAELAEDINVSRKTINTVENGVFIPSTVLALTLAKRLNCSVHDLFALQEK